MAAPMAGGYTPACLPNVTDTAGERALLFAADIVSNIL
jgi:hypothetical protein